MTKKEEEAIAYCCCLVIVLAIIGTIIMYWYITLPIALGGLGIYLAIKSSNNKKSRKKQQAYNEYWSNKKQALVAEQTKEYKHYKFGERLHPDEWYEEKCPNCQSNLVHSNHCEYCGWIKKEKEERSRHISSKVRLEVWRRDYGKCVECGSKERLEYDHIIPFSKGGSNTARNIQLLCEICNRKKHNKIE